MDDGTWFNLVSFEVIENIKNRHKIKNFFTRKISNSNEFLLSFFFVKKYFCIKWRKIYENKFHICFLCTIFTCFVCHACYIFHVIKYLLLWINLIGKEKKVSKLIENSVIRALNLAVCVYFNYRFEKSGKCLIMENYSLSIAHFRDSKIISDENKNFDFTNLLL